jgi:hypothetical protein
MTTKEQQTVDQLCKIIADQREGFKEFKEAMELKISSLEKQVEQKHMPLSLETEVVKVAQNAITTALTSAMTGYGSPLVKYATNVVAKYQSSLEAIFDNAVREGINTDEFKSRVREVLISKIAKTMISGVDGSIDKTINLMKQDQVFRSRLTLSVNTLVEEFLGQSK